MATIIEASTAPHYVWGEANDGFRLVDRDELSLIQERMAPGGREVPHRHARARQFFHVIAGEFSMKVEGRVHTLRAGQGIEIAPGVAHQALNLSDQPTEFLVTSTPSTTGDRENV